MPIERPSPSEYNEFYSTYVDKVPAGDILETLRGQIPQAQALVRQVAALGRESESFRYAPGKWNLKQVLGHMSDTERVFAYRCFAFARDPATALPGMDQDVYAAANDVEERTFADIAQEWETARHATLSLAESLTPTQLLHQGTACGYPFTVRSFLWILAGHWTHHRRVLEERYLGPG